MIALSKLQEKIGACPTPVPPAVKGNRGKRGGKRADENCPPPLYIVGGVSSASAIPFHTAENIILAAGFASSIGFPLTYNLTVKRLDDEGRDHASLLRKIAEWQRYHIGVPVFVWAREATSGPHSHFLLHIPRHRADKFRKLARHWVKEIFGVRRLPPKTFSMTKIRSHGDPFEHIRNRVRYILKGADADTRKFIGCKKWETGVVGGKKAGVFQCLGEAARKKSGGVIASGLRKPNPEMLVAATIRDQRREAFRESFRQINHTITQAAC